MAVSTVIAAGCGRPPAVDEAQTACSASPSAMAVAPSAAADESTVSLRYPNPVCELALPVHRVQEVWNEHAGTGAWRVSGDDDLESSGGRLTIGTSRGSAGRVATITVNIKSDVDHGRAWRIDAPGLAPFVQSLATEVADDAAFGELVRRTFDAATAATAPHHELFQDERGLTILVAANRDQIVMAVTGPPPPDP
jgi:hypothetical protein